VKTSSPLARGARGFAFIGIGGWLLANFARTLAGATSEPPDKPSQQSVIARLLSEPAPPPDWRQYLKKRKETPPAKPPADAALDDLTNYWRIAPDSQTPDEATRAKLLEACESKPEELDELLPRLALDSPVVQERLKKLYDRLLADRRNDDVARVAALQNALMTHGNYFRDELKRRAFFPDDVTEQAFVDAVSALIRHDREGGRQLFLKESTSNDMWRRVMAISQLRRYFRTETDPETAAACLNELKRIVADRKVENRTREWALTSVMNTQTPENDQWFLELFRDPTLDIREQYSDSSTPLGNVVALRPDYWIPKIALLVGSNDAATHANAVHALIYFHRDRSRADALRPLLPWLDNPKWAPDPEEIHGRSTLIQTLDRVDLPEAVPGLLRLIGTASNYDLAGAAEALAHYKARAAIEPLKRVLKRETDEQQRARITKALAELGGFSSAEMVEALKLYAIQISTEEGQKAAHEAMEILPKAHLDPRASVGKELSRSDRADDSLTAELLKEADRLSGSNPAAADILRRFIVRWQTPSATNAMGDGLRRGDFTVEWVKELVDQRTRWAEPLLKVRNVEGLALGIQAALTVDPGLINQVLARQDRFARLGMLAVARLARVELPLGPIANWLASEDQQLARAAELYLEANDSAQARTEIWRLAPGAAKILGARWYFDPGHFTFGAFDETESKLRDAVLGKKGPEAIYALLSEGYWGSNGQRVLFVENGKTILRAADGNGRTRECEIPEREMKSLIDWLQHERIEDLPPFDAGAFDGMQWEFVRLTRDGGRRIFMNNPPEGGGVPRVEPGAAPSDPNPAIYGELTRRFTNLTDRAMRVVYHTLSDKEGFQIVHAREKGEVVAIRKDKDQLMAGIRLPSNNGTAWHRVAEAGLSADFTVQEARNWSDEAEDDEKAVDVHEGPLAGKKLHPTLFDRKRESGLWALGPNSKDELIAKGNFDRPVICPGGEWVVVARTPPGKMWDVPNGMFRIHLPDKHIFPVDLPAADTFDALAWVEAHKRVLLYQKREWERGEAGPKDAEFYLLDPISGKHEKVDGEFRPFFDAHKQPLQVTSQKNEVWAVLHPAEIDFRPEPTATIGRFDTYNFRFTPLIICPDVLFESDHTFVDEAAHVVWIAVNGDLLRISLPNK
jgi:HEAT repeat protein